MPKSADITIQPQITGRGCLNSCPMLVRCRRDQLWLDGSLPCEGVLADEVGMEFDADSLPTLWVMPLEVQVNVGAG